MTNKNRIKELRIEKDLSQRKLGNIIGTAQQTISRLEKGNYSPPVDLVVNLAKYFDCSIDYLLGLSECREKFEDRLYLDNKLEEHYELIKMYDQLGHINKETLRIILKRLNDTEPIENKR